MPELEVWLCPVHSSLDESGKLEPMTNCVACLQVERDELRNDLDGISALFPDSAPHKHSETGVSLHDDVRDLLRDKRREYERAEANWRNLVAAEERERGLREVLTKARRLISEVYPPYEQSGQEQTECEFAIAHGLLVEIGNALAQHSEAARMDGERSDTERIDRLQSLGDNLEIVIDGDLIGKRVAISWNAWSGRSL